MDFLHGTQSTSTPHTSNANGECEFDASSSHLDTHITPTHVPSQSPSQPAVELNSNQSNTTTTTNKKRRSTSFVWNVFEKYKDENGTQRAKCKDCGVNYAIGSNTHGTSNLKKHLDDDGNCPVVTPKTVKQMHLEHELKLRKRKINQETLREKLAISIMKHNLPYTFVEYEGIRDLFKYLNEDVKHITRNTTRSDCMKLYKQKKEMLRQSLARVPGRICLTSDLWSSATKEGYLCLTAHFVDESWTLQSKILDFSHFVPPHTGIRLSEAIFAVLKDWSIDKKIFSITLDNATNNDNMQDLLRKKLSLHDNLYDGGNYFHIRCSAHILNLIVKAGLKVRSDCLDKVRDCIKYIKGSESRLINFSRCAKDEGISTSMGLRMDCDTRWNSTFLMLESALRYRPTFYRYSLLDPGFNTCLTNDEWDKIEKFCRFLRPFDTVTTLFSGSEYPIANLYFYNVWRIHMILIENKSGDDPDLKKIATEMQPKFEKYWNSYSVILSFAVVLDPRYKLDFVEYCYFKTDPITSKAKVASLKRDLLNLYGEYASRHSSHVSSQSSILIDGRGNEMIDNEDFIADFDVFEGDTSSTDKSELDLYLDEKRHDRKQHAKMSILEFWESASRRYPILSIMARDVLSIPITTVASESTFSIGAKVINKYRTSLKPESAHSTICTRNWLCGYEEGDNGEYKEKDLLISLEENTSQQNEGSTTIGENVNL